MMATWRSKKITVTLNVSFLLGTCGLALFAADNRDQEALSMTSDSSAETPEVGESAARALACSVPDQLPTSMSPTIIFHTTANKTVPCANSVTFWDKLVNERNCCELVTFEGFGHFFYGSSKYNEAAKVAGKKTGEYVAVFFANLELMKKGYAQLVEVTRIINYQ